MIPLFLALLFAPEKASVEGVVRNTLTNEPLRKAQVVLEAGKKRFAVQSGKDGAFRFEGLESGEYHLEAQRQGYLDSDDEPWFDLAPGEQVRNVVIKLTPQGVIAGHVVDDDGDPVPGLTVNAARTIHIDGRAIVLGTEGAITDNEGYFLVSELPAGRYYLSAEPSRQARQEALPGHPGTEEEFVHTADPIPRDVTPGGALRDVKLQMRKSAVFRIRGRVSNPPNGSAAIFLVPPGETAGPNRPQAGLRDGTFEFSGIAPGSYVLVMAMYATPDRIATSPAFCYVPVTVVDRDIDGLAIELTPGPGIEGAIRMEGGHFEKPPALQLMGNFQNSAATAKEDGTFGWTNLAPKKYWIDYGPPDGYYVQSIRFNQRPLNSIMIDLTSGIGGKLEIVVAPHAGALSITVQGGKPATVAVWNASTFRASDTDTEGILRFDHLAPGEYKMLAWQKIEEQFVEIPEFRARFEAKTIALADDMQLSVKLQSIPKSASDAEIAKLQ